MADLGQHIRIRLKDDRVIAPGDRERRILARVVLTVAEDLPILCFGLADTHLHAESLGDERLANEIARRIGGSLRRLLKLPVGFHTLPPRPILDLWHLGRCFRYVQTQAIHHGVPWPRWYEATSLPDLLGLRPRGGFLVARMREHLPRLKATDLVGWLGVSEIRPLPISSREVPPEEVLDAALAAAVLPSVHGRSQEVLACRRAMIEQLGPEYPRAALASSLGISTHSVSRLRKLPPDPALVRAIGLTLGLWESLRSRAAEATDPSPGSPVQH